MVAQKYRWDFIGLSTDDKPTSETSDKVVNGSTYYCSDTSKLYVYCDGTWYERKPLGGGGSGGGAIELTSADYNWPIANPDGVALWLLEPGMYYTEGAQVYMSGNQIGDITNRGTFIVGDDYGTGNPAKLILYYDQYAPVAYLISTIISSGNRSSKNSLLPPTVVQTAGTSTTSVMSQNAVTSMVFADPSTTKKVQIGNSANAGGNTSIAIGKSANSSKPDTVAIGNSSTSSANNTIAIGGSSSAEAISCIAIGTQAVARSNYAAVAIGANSSATGQGSIAIGRNSSAYQTGEMNIGSSDILYGYNSSNYRLLTGVYDPQNAHDAATKGYVDPTTDSSAPTTATVGRLGQIQIDTTTATAYMCVAVDTVTPAYTWKQITA